MQVLEDGGTYTEKLHQFYHLQSTFNEDAREWAKIALAKALLNRTMNAYKQDRFPKVMEKAEEYFAFLTNDEYRKIHFKEEGTFLIERKDGVTFNPAELSRGTGEQLYTAIRFALVYVLSKDHPFPIIIDDGFVNFDKRRTKRVIQLIEKISDSSQVLLFTCHEHIKEQFSESNIFSLTENQ